MKAACPETLWNLKERLEQVLFPKNWSKLLVKDRHREFVEQAIVFHFRNNVGGCIVLHELRKSQMSRPHQERFKAPPLRGHIKGDLSKHV